MVSEPLVSIFGLSTSSCSDSTKNQPIWLHFGPNLANSFLRLLFLSLRNQFPGSQSRLSFLIMVFLNALRGGVMPCPRLAPPLSAAGRRVSITPPQCHADAMLRGQEVIEGSVRPVDLSFPAAQVPGISQGSAPWAV